MPRTAVRPRPRGQSREGSVREDGTSGSQDSSSLTLVPLLPTADPDQAIRNTGQAQSNLGALHSWGKCFLKKEKAQKEPCRLP